MATNHYVYSREGLNIAIMGALSISFVVKGGTLRRLLSSAQAWVSLLMVRGIISSLSYLQDPGLNL